jgi:hypothetical protein
MSIPPAPNESNRVDIILADTKTILSILDGLAEGVIPLAPLKAAVKVAKEIVDMTQVSHSSPSMGITGSTCSVLQKVRKNEDDCVQLSRRIYVLVATVVDTLKEKRDDEVPDAIKRNLLNMNRCAQGLQQMVRRLIVDQAYL